jgi:hypothetical protein
MKTCNNLVYRKILLTTEGLKYLNAIVFTQVIQSIFTFKKDKICIHSYKVKCLYQLQLLWIVLQNKCVSIQYCFIFPQNMSLEDCNKAGKE